MTPRPAMVPQCLWALTLRDRRQTGLAARCHVIGRSPDDLGRQHRRPRSPTTQITTRPASRQRRGASREPCPRGAEARRVVIDASWPLASPISVGSGCENNWGAENARKSNPSFADFSRWRNLFFLLLFFPAAMDCCIPIDEESSELSGSLGWQ